MTIEEILTAKEGENFEFKTAANRFSYTELQKYASAISNEGGGKIVFGITDKRPRKVVGSKAFDQPERTRKGLIDSLRINVDFEVFNDGTESRVLVFIVPARPIGLPVQVDGVAWWRDGDSHRNYQLPGSVFVRQYNDRIEFESPGGFIGDITAENIIDRQSARNRRLAEILGRCGLVERSGQGMNLIYEESVKDAKPLPDFEGTTDSRVRLTLGAVIVDESIIRLLKAIGEKTLASFATEDFVAVRAVLMGDKLNRQLKRRIPRLVSIGVLERVGRSKVLVSRQYYKSIGKGGAFTRLKGLDNGTNKALLVQHMKDMGNPGLKLSDFQQVLPSLSIRQIQWLLKDLEANNMVFVKGRTRSARWFLGQRASELTSGLTSELTSIDNG